MRAKPLHCLQLVRAQQDHLSTARQLLNQAPQDERRSNIQSGKRLVQQDEIWIVQESSG